MIIENPKVKSMKHVKAGFDQLVLFTYCVEELLPRGVWSICTMTQKVRIYYVGMIDGLHKYQLGCIETDYKLERKADSTLEVAKKLNSVFRLLVLGTDGSGRLQKIYNFAYLQQEWTELKAHLLIQYDDTDVEKWSLILNMDVLLQTHDTVLNYLKLPNMFGLFFNGYWRPILPEEITKAEQLYGQELENQQFKESLQYSIQETTKQQLIQIDIKGNSISNEKINYTGRCIFLDGALDVCNKKIETDSITFNYSARWVGLKQLFQL